VSALSCPACGRVNDLHDRAPGEAPRNGDVSVCWSCGGLAFFADVDGSLALVRPTAEEQAELERNPELARVRAAIAAAASPSQALDVLWGSS
jgi:hypothetical protein